MASCDVTVIRDYKLTTYTVHRPVDQHDVRQQIVIVIKICLEPSPKNTGKWISVSLLNINLIRNRVFKKHRYR